MPSSLALDAPVNEEKYIFKLPHQKELKSHSDRGHESLSFLIIIIYEEQSHSENKHRLSSLIIPNDIIKV